MTSISTKEIASSSNHECDLDDVSYKRPWHIANRLEELSKYDEQEYLNIRVLEAERLCMPIDCLDSAMKFQREQHANNILGQLDAMILSDLETDRLSNAKFIIDGLIVEGHLHVVAAEPNGGKTTIFSNLAKDMVKAGYEVRYINADIAASDYKKARKLADLGGYKLIAPDMKLGESMQRVIDMIDELVKTHIDLSKQVFIFDTLKKMMDVINKSSVKQGLGKLRALTGKGATIICLAHTNKYRHQGELIFEGTGDIRSDVDNLIYMDSQKQSDGSILVSTRADKVRALLHKQTYRISPPPGLEVSLEKEYVDISAEIRTQMQMSDDQEVIDKITEAINNKYIKQCEITEYCRRCGIGSRKTSKVLKRYAGNLWKIRIGSKNNTKFYELSSHPVKT